jgi:hypothetical protein
MIGGFSFSYIQNLFVKVLRCILLLEGTLHRVGIHPSTASATTRTESKRPPCVKLPHRDTETYLFTNLRTKRFGLI